MSFPRNIYSVIKVARASKVAPDYPNPVGDDNYGQIKNWINNNWIDPTTDAIHDRYKANVLSLLWDELTGDRRKQVMSYLWDLVVGDMPD